jgi:hypothetical protein
MEMLRSPKKRIAGGSRATPGALEMVAGDARFERISRWTFWTILFAGTAAALWFR